MLYAVRTDNTSLGSNDDIYSGYTNTLTEDNKPKKRVGWGLEDWYIVFTARVSRDTKRLTQRIFGRGSLFFTVFVCFTLLKSCNKF